MKAMLTKTAFVIWASLFLLAGMVYVEDLDRVFLFSGSQDTSPNLPTDIWLYDLNTNTWEKVGP